MADKILDDDDIIDLTDLLEEGEPKKKGKEKKGGSSASANEPDSFDLGKEISMEYEVSVEEIEQSSEGLDIDASLSSHEEVALAQEKEGGEGTPASEEAGEVILDDNRDKGAGKKDLLGDGSETILQQAEVSAKTGSEIDTGGMAEAVSEKAVEEVSEEPVSASASAGLDAEKAVVEGSKGIPDIQRDGRDTGGLPADIPVQNVLQPGITEELLGDLKREVPAMLEGVVKPLMVELVREMVTATREQLPGIVEKVIREEIEKLKKLDS